MANNMTYSVVAANGDTPVFRITAYDSDFSYQLSSDYLAAEQVFLFDSSRGSSVFGPNFRWWRSDDTTAPEWKLAGEGAYTRDLAPADIYQAARALNTKYRLLECLIGYSFPVIPNDELATGASAFGLTIPFEHPEHVKNFPLNTNRDGWYEPRIWDADVIAIRNTIRLFCAFAECGAGNVFMKPAPLRYAGTKLGLPCLESLSYEGLFYALAWAVIYVLDAARRNKDADPTFGGIIESEGAHAQVQQYLQYAARVTGGLINLKQGRSTYTPETDGASRHKRAFEPWTYPRASQSRWNMGYTPHGKNNPGMWCQAPIGDVFYYHKLRDRPRCTGHLRVMMELDGQETVHCVECWY